MINSQKSYLFDGYVVSWSPSWKKKKTRKKQKKKLKMKKLRKRISKKWNENRQSGKLMLMFVQHMIVSRDINKGKAIFSSGLIIG